MRQNPGARIIDYDIAALIDSSFTKAARLEIAQNGFKCTGISIVKFLVILIFYQLP